MNSFCGKAFLGVNAQKTFFQLPNLISCVPLGEKLNMDHVDLYLRYMAYPNLVPRSEIWGRD